MSPRNENKSECLLILILLDHFAFFLRMVPWVPTTPSDAYTLILFAGMCASSTRNAAAYSPPIPPPIIRALFLPRPAVGRALTCIDAHSSACDCISRSPSMALIRRG